MLCENLHLLLEFLHGVEWMNINAELVAFKLRKIQ